MTANNNRKSSSPCHFEALESRELFASGTLDPAFNGTGKATIDFGGGITSAMYEVAVQSDGKTVVAGQAWKGGSSYAALARFNSDGTLDRTFGPNRSGVVMTQVNGGSWGRDMAIQPDGKIVVVGCAGSAGSAVWRFNSDGTLDNTFDRDGRMSFKFHDASWANSVALQKDGKIVVAGGDYEVPLFSSIDYDFTIVRLNANGSMDRTFDGDGKRSIGFGWKEEAMAVTIDYSGTSSTNRNYGKIILAGNQTFGSTSQSLVVTRLNANGSTDTSFNRANGIGHDGTLRWSFNGRFSSISDMIMQRDGKIVITGPSGKWNVYGDTQFALARLDNDGWFDSAFNGGHVVETDFGGNDMAFGVVQTWSGGLVVGGTVNGRLALASYKTDGSLNASFGTGGKVKLDIGRTYAGDVGGLAQAPTGKLVITGGYDSSTARLFNGTPFRPGDGGLGGRLIRSFNATSTTASSSEAETAKSSLFGTRPIVDERI
jgi:uncharacterized delta-60 repeat protein